MIPPLEPSFELILFFHFLGDYLFQIRWCAENKFLPDDFDQIKKGLSKREVKRLIFRSWLAAGIHAIAYTACYLALTRDVGDLFIIGVSHLLIDHYRVAAIVARIKEWDWKTPQPIIPPFVIFILDQGMHIFINCFMLQN